MSSSPRVAEAREAFAAHRAARADAPRSLFDQPPMDAAIASVVDHAGSEWVEHVVSLVRAVALEQELVTVDDIAPRITEAVYDRRALGGAMRAAARRGLIASTGQFVKSSRNSRHRSPVALWRSLLYREAGR